MGSEALASFLCQEIDDLRQKSLYRELRLLGGPQGPEAEIDGRRVVNLSSNNYLGLTTHPRLKKAAADAIARLGVGSGAVRTIIGTMDVHMELERKLAAFKKTEAALVFQSGCAANQGTIAALIRQGDVVISDELNHASIIDGCRLSRGETLVYPHKDVAALRRLLKERSDAPGLKLVVTDGVFSMDGDIAPLPQIVEAAEGFGAAVMVDDAHASGVLGRDGRGTVDHFGLHGRVDIQIGTLSKAIGALGGYVAGSRDLADYLVHRARPFLFSTSHPPSVAATCIAALDILQEEPALIDRLWENTRYFKKGLINLGFNAGQSETPITPVIVGDGALAMKLSDELFAAGVFAQGIAYPTVPVGKARVRTIVTAAHTRDHLDFALEKFAGVGRKLGLIAA